MNNKEIPNVHDKGYKELYSNKTVFLDLLQNMLKLDWARDVTPDDLVMTDKSFVTSDYSDLESDLVYRLELNGQETYVYVLLEFQSTVDYRMPWRLLEYMTELLREYMKEANFSKGDTKVHIPAIFPIVLYNGEAPWEASLSLRDITDGGEIFGDHLLNFRYTLLDINHAYTEEDLLSNDCISAIIMLLDQNVSVPVILKRLKEIVERFRSLAEGQNRQIISHWVQKSANPMFANGFVEIIKADQKEGSKMVSNLSTLYERSVKMDVEKSRLEGMQEGRLKGKQEGMQEGRLKGKQEGIQEGIERGIERGIEKGIEKGALEEKRKIAMRLIQNKMDLKTISNITNLTIEELQNLLN